MADRGSHRGGGRGGGGGGGGGGGERGNFRGRGGGRGGHHGPGRGGGGQHGGGHGHSQNQHGGQGEGEQQRPKKENILDLSKYSDKRITVKFNGGREVSGVLKGYDPLMNLVLDEVKETMRDDEGKETTRDLGLTVARGTMIVLISPIDGSEEIANPFAQAED